MSTIYHIPDNPQDPADHWDADATHQAVDGAENPWSIFNPDDSPAAVKRRDRARLRDFQRLSQSESAGRGMFCHVERIGDLEVLAIRDDPPNPDAMPLGYAGVYRGAGQEVYVLQFGLSSLGSLRQDVAETLLTVIEFTARVDQHLSVVFLVRPKRDDVLIDFLTRHGYKHPNLKFRADPPPQQIELRKQISDVLAGQNQGRGLFRKSPAILARGPRG
jgi:hypothetical protein